MSHPLSPETPARRFAKRSRAHSAATLLGLAGLLASCAAPGPQTSSTSQPASNPAPLASLPVMDTLKVLELRGTATATDAGRRIALKSGSNIGENQPIQVSAKSTLRLALGRRAVFELGPNSRFVVHQLPRDGAGEDRATWLRLEQGYLRVAASNDREDAPIEVSFSRWAARLEPGESFLEARNDSAAACASNGRLHLSGVPEWTPQDLDQSCATLEPRRAPVSVALSDAEWSALRTQRRLQPVLARAAEVQASHAIARMERERSGPGLSKNDATLVQSIAYMPPAPGVEPVSMPAYAAPPPAPAVTIYTGPPEPALESQPDAGLEPAPLVASDGARQDSASPDHSVATSAGADAPLAGGQTIVVAEPTANAPTSAAASSPNTADTQVPVRSPAPPASILGPSSLSTVATDPVGSSLKWNPQVGAVDDLRSAAPVPPAGDLEVAAYSATGNNGLPSSEIPMPESAMIAPASPAPENLPVEWIVNVASYPSVETAQQHAQQLVAQNYAAGVRRETVRGRASYRVVIEGLPTEAAAQTAANELSSRYGLRSAWALRKH